MNAPDQSPVPSDSTALTVRTNLAKVETALSEFDKIESGLAELREKYTGVVYAVTTTAGMKEATAARAEIREPRYKTEHARKAGKAPVLELGRNIEQRAAYITDELLKIETPIDDQIKAEESRKEREREAKEKAEAERVARIQSRIDEIRHVALDAVGRSAANIALLIDELKQSEGCAWAEEFQDVAEAAKVQTMTRLTTMFSLAVEAEAEAARLAAERAELERQKAEQLAEHRRLEAEHQERERIAEQERQARAREEKRLMDESIARRVAEDKAARERIAELERVAKAERDEEDRIARQRREAEEARLRAEREALDREKADREAKERAAREAEERQAAEAQAEKDRAARAEADRLEGEEREVARREADVMDAYAMLRTFRERFNRIPEFAKVLKAIDAVLKMQPETVS